MNVEFFLTDYDQLPVGKYRIVFGIAHSNDFLLFFLTLSILNLTKEQGYIPALFIILILHLFLSIILLFSYSASSAAWLPL